MNRSCGLKVAGLFQPGSIRLILKVSTQGKEREGSVVESVKEIWLKCNKYNHRAKLRLLWNSGKIRNEQIWMIFNSKVRIWNSNQVNVELYGVKVTFIYWRFLHPLLATTGSGSQSPASKKKKINKQMAGIRSSQHVEAWSDVSFCATLFCLWCAAFLRWVRNAF